MYSFIKKNIIIFFIFALVVSGCTDRYNAQYYQYPVPSYSNYDQDSYYTPYRPNYQAPPARSYSPPARGQQYYDYDSNYYQPNVPPQPYRAPPSYPYDNDSSYYYNYPPRSGLNRPYIPNTNSYDVSR